MELCKLCGAEMKEGVCPSGHEYKKMCINCAFCKAEGDIYSCHNGENEEDAVEKIKTAAKEAAGGYEIDNIQIKLMPLVLKKPTAKCKRWELDNEVLEEIIKNNFK